MAAYRRAHDCHLRADCLERPGSAPEPKLFRVWDYLNYFLFENYFKQVENVIIWLLYTWMVLLYRQLKLTNADADAY